MVNEVIRTSNSSFSTEGTESKDENTASNVSPEISQRRFQGLLPKHQTDKKGTSFSKFFAASSKGVTRIKGTSKNELVEPRPLILRALPGERPTTFSVNQIKSFTKDFYSKIGIGGFGTTYKGVMRDGVCVAVKKLTKCGEEEVFAEVEILRMTSHRNIVKLLGYCVDGDVTALVYEYVPNGSLAEFLLSNRNHTDWVRLQNIAVETAKGISYLHEGCPEVIIHRDVKPSNILLDAKFSPKLADFGLAVFEKDKVKGIFEGTFGYFDPAYYRTSCATCENDVYSFGMVLFDMLGRYNLGLSEGRNSYRFFQEQVWEKFKKGILNYQNGEEGRMSMAALWCIQDKPEDRPSMSTVINILKGDTKKGQPPYPFSSYSKSYPFTSTGSDSISS